MSDHLPFLFKDAPALVEVCTWHWFLTLMRHISCHCGGSNSGTAALACIRALAQTVGRLVENVSLLFTLAPDILSLLRRRSRIISCFLSSVTDLKKQVFISENCPLSVLTVWAAHSNRTVRTTAGINQKTAAPAQREHRYESLVIYWKQQSEMKISTTRIA